MQQINPYHDALNKLIAETQANISISHFKNAEGLAASWHDKVWTNTNSKGQTNNYWFITETNKGMSLATGIKKPILPSPFCEILMIYTVHVNGLSITRQYKRTKQSAPRSLLFKICSLDDISNEFLKQYLGMRCKSSIPHTNYFITWMQSKNLITNNIYPIKIKQDNKAGFDVDYARQEKLPNEKVLVALGAIHYDLIPPVEKLWKTNPLAIQRDAFVCAMAALAMGSPNRAAAEQTIIDNQELKSHTETVAGKKQTVFYLDWKGSKGYQNNQNHILSSLSVTVKRSIKYMQKATEPNRVLARFYTNPNLSLKRVLFNHRVDEARWNKVIPDITKPINLFTLAYLLGLYNNDNASAQVIKGTAGAFKFNPKTPNSAWMKPMAMLSSSDVLQVTGLSIGPLLCAQNNNQSSLLKLFGAGGFSVAEIQQKWITYVKACFPAFPRLANNTKNGECDARTRLFAFSGHQTGTKAGSTSAGYNLPLMPVSPDALATIFSNEVKTIKGKSIFTRHGFSEEFSMTPHQFRHYLNHTADENNVPRIIINMWSGRKDPTQIVHYVHTIGADKASRISDILFDESIVTVDEAKQSIRIHSKDEYNNLTNSVATESSSGLCTQALMINPCNFLNDFDTQCVFCASSVHVAHDEDAISLLKKDFLIQTQRLQEVAEHPKLVTSEAMRNWYKVHFKNTEMLRQLIELMTSKDIKEGSLIRLLTSKTEFRITNLQTKIVDKRKMALPDPDKKLAELLDHKKQNAGSDTILDELLGMI
jgi:hypothetical protein